MCNSLGPMNRSTPGLPVHHQLPEFTQTHAHESVMSYNHLILCRPLLLPPSIFPSIRVFSNESFLCIRWPEYWSFNFSISPSNEYVHIDHVADPQNLSKTTLCLSEVKPLITACKPLCVQVHTVRSVCYVHIGLFPVPWYVTASSSFHLISFFLENKLP